LSIANDFFSIHPQGPNFLQSIFPFAIASCSSRDRAAENGWLRGASGGALRVAYSSSLPQQK
jgi:hypothetical protein